MFKLEIRTDNAAFGDRMSSDCLEEVARILEDIARKVRYGNEGGACRDVNGNSVGSWGFDEGPEDE